MISSYVVWIYWHSLFDIIWPVSSFLHILRGGDVDDDMDELCAVTQKIINRNVVLIHHLHVLHHKQQHFFINRLLCFVTCISPLQTTFFHQQAVEQILFPWSSVGIYQGKPKKILTWWAVFRIKWGLFTLCQNLIFILNLRYALWWENSRVSTEMSGLLNSMNWNLCINA